MKRVILAAALLSIGAGIAYGEGCQVAEVLPDSPAFAAGIKPGDRIIAAGGATIRAHDDLVGAVRASTGTLRLIVQRGAVTEEITARQVADPKGNRLGVDCSYGEASAAQPAPPILQLPKNSLTFGVGPAFPLAKLDTGFIGAGHQEIGQPGYNLGGQYLHSFTPQIEAGLEGSYTHLGKHQFQMAPFSADLSMRSTEILGLVKLHRPRTDAMTPYFLLGLGVHITEFEWNVTPNAPYFWLSGSPNEARALVSSRKTGAALATGVGVDVDFAPGYFGSIEGRLDNLAKQTYDTTPLGQSLGIASVEAGAFNASIVLRVGLRFGPGDVVPSLQAPSAVPPPSDRSVPAPRRGTVPEPGGVM